MSYLVRKINKAKWYQIDIDKDDNVTADAITNCLKTTRNTLSVWKIESEDDLDQAVLALVANQDRLETIDIVILDEKSLEDYNINIVASPGNTPVYSLINTHRDISDLTYTELGTVKDHIVERIRSQKIIRYTASSLKNLLVEAIEEGLVKKEDLKESVQKKV